MPVDYETTFILKPDLSEEDINAIIERVSTIITEGGATINKVDQWGRRRLTYEIQKLREGYYVFISFAMEKSSNTVNRLEKFFGLQENVLRYLTVVAPDPRPRGRRKDKKAEKVQQLVDQNKAEGEGMTPTATEISPVTESSTQDE